MVLILVKYAAELGLLLAAISSVSAAPNPEQHQGKLEIIPESNANIVEDLSPLNQSVDLFNVALNNYVRSLGANEQLQELLDKAKAIETMLNDGTVKPSLRSANIIDNNRSLKQLLNEMKQNVNFQSEFRETDNGHYWKRVILEYSKISDQLNKINDFLENHENNCDDQQLILPSKLFVLMRDNSKEVFALISRFSYNLALLKTESIEPIDHLASQLQLTLKKWPHVVLLGNIAHDANVARIDSLLEQYLHSSITKKTFQSKLSTFPEKYKNFARNVAYWFEREELHLSSANDEPQRSCPYRACQC